MSLPSRNTSVQVDPSSAQSAIDKAGPSTRIVLKPGNYPGLKIHNKSGLSVVASSAGGVTLASGKLDSGAGMSIQNSSDIAISGVSVTNSLFGIEVRSSSKVTVASNTVNRIGQEAIHVGSNSSNVTIANNTISYTGQRPGTDPEQGYPYYTYGEGIYIGTGRGPTDTTNGVKVVGNEIHHTSSEAIDIKPGTHNITVERNIIRDISTQTSGAVVVHIGTAPQSNGNISIRQNLIWNVSRTSQWTDGNAIVASGPAHIQANIIWNTQHRGVLINDVYGSNRNVAVRRNVIFNNGVAAVEMWDHSPALNPSLADNIDGSIFQTSAFDGTWIVNNQPTTELLRLMAALNNDSIPMNEIR